MPKSYTLIKSVIFMLEMNVFESNGQKMSYLRHGRGNGNICFIWAHGWGQSHAALLPISKALTNLGDHYLIDFPGFGTSNLPKESWDAEDYAAYMKKFVKSLKAERVVWICHSFGARIGLRLAAENKKMFSGVVVIGGHGVPPKRSLFKKLRLFLTVRFFKFMKILARSEQQLELLRSKFGSADYRNAGPIRDIFMNIIRDDLTEQLPDVTCPVRFYYGSKDLETPPEMGQRMADLVQNGAFEKLDGFDHYTILSDAKHQISARIKQFIKEEL